HRARRKLHRDPRPFPGMPKQARRMDGLRFSSPFSGPWRPTNCCMHKRMGLPLCHNIAMMTLNYQQTKNWGTGIMTDAIAIGHAPQMGEKMPDGTIYAGISPDSGKAMYA